MGCVSGYFYVISTSVYSIGRKIRKYISLIFFSKVIAERFELARWIELIWFSWRRRLLVWPRRRSVLVGTILGQFFFLCDYYSAFVFFSCQCYLSWCYYIHQKKLCLDLGAAHIIIVAKSNWFYKKMIHYNTRVSLLVRDIVGCEFPCYPFNPPFFRFIYFKIHSFAVKS